MSAEMTPEQRGKALHEATQAIQNAVAEIQDLGPWPNNRIENPARIIGLAAEIMEGEAVGQPALDQGLVTEMRKILNTPHAL